VVQSIKGLIESFIGITQSIVSALWTMFQDLLELCLLLLDQVVGTDLLNRWNNLDLQPLADAFAAIDYYIPIPASAAILIGAWSVVMSIRVVRHILGGVPTANLG